MTFTRNGKFREALIVRRLGPIRRSAEGRFFGAARYRGIADEEGRRQAFALVAGRCSVADAEILFEIREKRLFRAMEVTWEDFCSKRIGVTRSYVDRIIRQYREPGAAFCKLNSFTRFKPAEYRVIAGAVSEDGLAYGAEIIPLEAQNAPRLAEAVDALRRDCIGETNPSDPVELAFAKAEKAVKSAVAEFARLEALDLHGETG